MLVTWTEDASNTDGGNIMAIIRLVVKEDHLFQLATHTACNLPEVVLLVPLVDSADRHVNDILKHPARGSNAKLRQALASPAGLVAARGHSNCCALPLGVVGQLIHDSADTGVQGDNFTFSIPQCAIWLWCERSTTTPEHVHVRVPQTPIEVEHHTLW